MNTPYKTHPPRVGHQSGAVLVTALLILLVLTILGVSATGDSALEERMAGSYRDTETAREAAELALRRAEVWIATNIDNIADLEYDNSDPDTIAQYMFRKAGSAPFLFNGTTQDDPRTIGLEAVDDADAIGLPASFQPLVKTDWENLDLGAEEGYLDALTPDEVSDLGLAASPRFIIEYAGRGPREGESVVLDAEGQSFNLRKFGFRITAIGWGRYVDQNDPTQPGTPYVLQSHFVLPM